MLSKQIRIIINMITDNYKRLGFEQPYEFYEHIKHNYNQNTTFILSEYFYN